MATTSFPALAINTQGESPINLLAKVEQIKGAQQSQQMGEIQLQEARMQQQSKQLLMASLAKNNGDYNATYADLASSGKMDPTMLQDFRIKSIAAQTDAAKLDEAKMNNLGKMHDLAANELEGFKALPVEQRTPQAVQAIAGRLGTAGVDISKIMPTLQSIVQDPSDNNIRNVEMAFKGEQWVLANEKAQREAASAPTVSQAQAKTQAELSKATDEAAAAHINLLSMPSPSEAKTIRVANLLKTQAETAAANATTAEKKAQTALLGAEPVFAYDQATNQRVLTTMPDAKAKGYTNPVKVSETDINKETEATKQFNDVQQNVSRYAMALKNSSIVTSDQGKLMSTILSDKTLLGSLEHLTGGGITSDVLTQKLKSSAWNNLTPDNRDLVVGYLRTTGSVGAFQKALTQTGRTSAELMKIEINNVPLPMEGATVGSQRLGAFQENIDTASQGLTKVPWLPTPRQVRDLVENQTEKPKTPDATEQLQRNLRMGAFNPPQLPDLVK